MANIDSNELIDLLSTYCIANVQNGLIHTLAIWLDEHVQGESVESRKRDAFSTFAQSVENTVMQRQHRRKVWPANQPLPYPYNQIEVIESLSDQLLQKMKAMSFEKGLTFLAELWGGWMLVCPYEIIRNSPEFAREMNSAKTEIELTELMLQYLDMVYGTM